MKSRKPLPRFFGSSVDSTKLSLTIKGILIGIVPLLIWALKQAGVEVAESDIMSVIEQAFSLIATATILVGGIRKLYYFVKSIINK